MGLFSSFSLTGKIIPLFEHLSLQGGWQRMADSKTWMEKWGRKMRMENVDDKLKQKCG